ncbi:MAG: lytic transglycosylase domain-containing protein [Bacteroidetes bacterium]|nr:lytic transglycosylase domain-containing protein [Bacteroidota bacterium]
MKQFLTILLIISFFSIKTKGSNLQQNENTGQELLADTTIVNSEKEKKAIAEIITSKSTPDKDKVQYISQLTRYGFKNLFTSFGYNPSLPYSSQINPHAEIYMQDYLKHHNNSLVKMKSWGVPYFNLIDNIFTQYGLPRELKYLAVIESNLQTSATSWVGAGGPWQFMPATARRLGLTVSRTIDDRRDYFKSTHAAARYLLELYQQMQDWLLVIAAYNGGPGRVYSAMKKSGSRDFWKLQYYLPEESRNHVKKFIATHYVMETPDNGIVYNSNFFVAGNQKDLYNKKAELSAEEQAASETQTISGKYNAAIISKNIGLSIDTFNRYNPGFNERLSANGQFDLTLPREKMQLFLANKYQILNECVQMLMSDDSIPNARINYPAAPAPGKKKKRKN